MTEAEFRSAIIRQLGELNTNVGEVKGKVDALGDRLTASESAAAKSRQGLYQQLAEHSTKFTKIDGEIAALQSTTKRVSDWVDSAVIVEAKNKAFIAVGRWVGVRAMRLLTWGLAAVGAALVAFWRELVDFLMVPK